MILVPSSAEPTEDMVQYHISVRVNCFSPSFWVTTILKTGSENSEYVGEFECVHDTILLYLSHLTFPLSEQDGLLECKAKQIVHPWQRVEVEKRFQSEFWCEWRVSSPPAQY